MEVGPDSNMHTDANPDPSQSYTTPTKIDYPEHLKTGEKEFYKMEILSNQPETLFADCNKAGKITNLIFSTDNWNAWYQAMLEYYPTHKVNKTSGTGYSQKLDIHIGEKKTAVSFYETTGKIVINADWEPFLKDFLKTKELAQTKKPKNKDKQNKPLSTEPDWSVEMKEMKDKISLLEVGQVKIEEEVRKSRPDSNGSDSDTEGNLATAYKRIEEKATQDNLRLVELVKKLEVRVAQDNRQFKQEIESLRESLTRERAQLEDQVENLRGEIIKLKSKLEEERMQNRDQIESEERAEQSLVEEISSRDRTEREEEANLSSVATNNPEQGPQEDEALSSTTTDTPENTPVQRPQIVLLMDSNGKYVDGKRLFPNHRVYQQKCPNTRSAIEWLTEEKLGAPSHIIIHTGTNNLRTQSRKQVTESVQKVVEKATSAFPGKKVIISALLPRKDRYGKDIPSINAQISRFCERKQNVFFASHPTLGEDSLWDEVHLWKAIVPTLAKKLKDVALDRNTARQPAAPKGWHHTARRGQPRGYPTRPQASPPSYIATPYQTPTPPHMHTQDPHPTPTNHHPRTYAQVVASPPQSVTTFALNTHQIQQIISEVLTRTVQANTGIQHHDGI